MTRRRRRGRNPRENHSGLGAFVGSLVGGIPGAIVAVMGAPRLGNIMTYMGWVGGGGFGAFYGASDDRKRRAAIGGTIGGLFTPLGAAFGGYVAGLEPDGPRRNPAGSTILVSVGAGVLAAGAGYGAYKLVQARRAAMLPGGEGVQSILDASTQLADVPFVVSDIQQPIILTRGVASEGADDVPVLRVMLAGQVVEPVLAKFGSGGSATAMQVWSDLQQSASEQIEPKAIAALLSGLTPAHTQAAYELALIQVGNGVDWTVAAERDAAIARILTELVPSTDWSKGLASYAYGGPEWQAWTATQTVGTVAAQSYANKRVLQGEGAA